MVEKVDFGGRPFHFIGIGGIGMSAIAQILAERDLPVSGSDVKLSHITKRLSDKGARIFTSQDATNLSAFSTELTSDKSNSLGKSKNHSVFCDEVDELVHVLDSDDLTSTEISDRSSDENDDPRVGDSPQVISSLPQIVCSTAINETNVEYRAALELGCPIFHRSDLLASLMEEYMSIAIGGTHGKTTTSSLIAFLLLKAGLDPTILIGGEVSAWDGNARLGQGKYLVAEADESDGSLVKFHPHIGVVTNIELDHPDHYSSLDEIINIFRQFRSQSQVLVGCLDCQTLREECTPTISYALDESLGADYLAQSPQYYADHTTAQIFERGKLIGSLSLRLLGKHNLSNALAAVAVGRYLGIPFEQISSILSAFEGTRRRLEKRGTYSNIEFLDDYAHHPSELIATLGAARVQASVDQSGKRRRIVAVFQPHRYSRTLAFLDEFARSFGDADFVVISDIYSAGETNVNNITGKDLADAIAYHHDNVVYKATLSDVEIFLKDALESGDLVLFLGAGNINKVIPDLLDCYRQKEDQVLQSSV